MSVEFELDPKFEDTIDLPALRKNVELLAIRLNLSAATVFTVAFVDDQEIQQLNQEFRGIDLSTDVLSFPADEINPEDNTHYIGDIIISLDTVLRQSIEHHISQLDEIHLLIIHGLLHLLGYDHDTEENKTAMWAEQAILLQLVDCPADPDRYDL